MGLFQSYGISNGILNLSDTVDPTLGSVAFFQISAVITMTSGTIFLMWLGEQITENGFGSGISIIIFSGIVANLPFAIFNTFELGRTGALSAIAIADRAPVLPSSNVLKIAKGRLATIPEKIIIEIPLPNPFSVICSPSHIKNIVPEVIVITAEI